MPSADDSEYPLRPCNHEEFDTKVMFQATNAVSHCYKRIRIIANDTGIIIIIGTSFFNDIGADKQWASFGIKTNSGIFQSMPRQKLFRIPCPDRIR